MWQPGFRLSSIGRWFDTILTYLPRNLPETQIEPEATAGHPAPNRTWTTSYDGAGLVTKEQQPGSVVLNRTFDEAGRPIRTRQMSSFWCHQM